MFSTCGRYLFTNEHEKMLFESCIKWLAHCRAQKIYPQLGVANHSLCSADCNLVQIEGTEMHICPIVGNYHLCGEVDCSRAELVEDMRVCVVTGMKFHCDAAYLDTFAEGKVIERDRGPSRKRKQLASEQLQRALSTEQQLARTVDDDRLVAISQLLETEYGTIHTTLTPAPLKPPSPPPPPPPAAASSPEQPTPKKVKVEGVSAPPPAKSWIPKEIRMSTLKEREYSRAAIETKAKAVVKLFFESQQSARSRKLTENPPPVPPYVIEEFQRACVLVWDMLGLAGKESGVEVRRIKSEYVCAVVLFNGMIRGLLSYPPSIDIPIHPYLGAKEFPERDLPKFSLDGKPFKNGIYGDTYKAIQSAIIWWNAVAFQSAEMKQRPLTLQHIKTNVPIRLPETTRLLALPEPQRPMLQITGAIETQTVLASPPSRAENNHTLVPDTPRSRANTTTPQPVVDSLDLIAHLL